MLLSDPHSAGTADGLITRRAAVEAGLDDRELRRFVRRRRAGASLRRGVYVDAGRWGIARSVPRAVPLLRCERQTWSWSAATSSSATTRPRSCTGSELPRSGHVPWSTSRAPRSTATPFAPAIKHHLAPYVPSQVVYVDGLPVLDPARTALDMAREHGLVAGVACSDAALRLGVTRADLEAARRRMWCWPGSRVMDAAMDLADPGAESWLESEARVFISRLGIGRPRSQFGLTNGERTVWCDLRVGRHVFEVDGRMKYSPATKMARHLTRCSGTRRRVRTSSRASRSASRASPQPTCRTNPTATRRRLLRDYADTCARFGTDISDLAPYIVQRPRR